jgi:hypothetical protein
MWWALHDGIACYPGYSYFAVQNCAGGFAQLHFVKLVIVDGGRTARVSAKE